MKLTDPLRPQAPLGRFLRIALRAVPRGARLRVISGPLRGATWIAGSGVAGAWLGTYERAKQIRIAQALGPGQCFWDIGAHAGFFSLLAARVVGPRGKVEAFEPAESNQAAFRQHIELNRLANVRLWPMAMGETAGKAAFQAGADGYQGRLSRLGTISVDVSSIDTMARHPEARLPDVIKIDVEVAEAAVLRGGEQVLRTRPPVLFLATHHAEAHAACCDLLRSWQYRLEPLETGQKIESTSELIAWPETSRSLKPYHV